MKKVKNSDKPYTTTQVVRKVTFNTYNELMVNVKQKCASWDIDMKKFISACIFLGLQKDEETIKAAINKLERTGGEI